MALNTAYAEQTEAIQEESFGPVGAGNYEVRSGDCLDSIAYAYGFTWKTLWELPENADLRRIRKDPNVLLPGDRLHIPSRRMKTVECATDQKHRFVRHHAPAMVRLRFLEDGEPRAGEAYVLKLDHRLVTGTLSRGGFLEVSISPGTRRAEIKVGDAPEFVTLDLGTVDPITEMKGIQGRLCNLGFNPGPIDGIYGPRTARALKDFQHSCKLAVSGEPNSETRDALVKEHGC